MKVNTLCMCSVYILIGMIYFKLFTMAYTVIDSMPDVINVSGQKFTSRDTGEPMFGVLYKEDLLLDIDKEYNCYLSPRVHEVTDVYNINGIYLLDGDRRIAAVEIPSDNKYELKFKLPHDEKPGSYTVVVEIILPVDFSKIVSFTEIHPL